MDHIQSHFDKVLQDYELDKSLLQITICGEQDSGKAASVADLIKQNVNKRHLLLDEVYDGEDDVSRHLSSVKEDDLNKCLWIVLDPERREESIGGQQRTLKRVFRNQPNIVRYLKRNEKEEFKEVDPNNPPVVTIFYHE